MKTNRKLKKPDSSSKLVLEEIIGLTTKSSNGLASSVRTANAFYLAGCVVVVYNVNSGSQSHLMVSHRTPKPLSCLAVSQDGRFVAAGESGPQRAVIVWDAVAMAFVSELKGHVYGISCIAFSPDGKHLVSVGGYIYLWDWRTGALVTKVKASSSCAAVSSVSFSSDAKSILTAGKKHLKFWTIASSPRTRLNTETGLVTINGKPVSLGNHQGSSFISVASALLADGSHGEALPVYALTESGVLCLVSSGWSVKKSVNLKVEKGFAVSASEKLIVCACNNGIVQLFSAETLKYCGSLIYSKSKQCHGDSDNSCHTEANTLPDAVACHFSTSEKLVVVYGDRCLYVWDIRDVNQASRCYTLVSHSACIWDIKNLCCKNFHDPSLACVARGCLGGVSFATCSADGTVRLWDLALQLNSPEDVMNTHASDTGQVGTSCLVSAGIFERDTVEAGITTQGFRALAVSSDGKYLSAGDCEGNIHIYDLQTYDYTCLQGAHDAEILSLSFSLSSKKDVIAKEVTDSHYYLASGSRDRMIHLFDVQRNFDLVESLDDHSAAVTSVKFTCNGCKILSCSADRSLVFRDFTEKESGHHIFRSHHQTASHGTVYDMAVDPSMEVVVTVGQDKKINTFDIASGKLSRSLRQDKDFGEPIKVTMDPSCSYLACSFSNKSICIYDFITGEMVLQAMGHGEVITGILFSPDCKHIISIGGDGCIFVWKVPAPLSSRMLERMKESYGPLSPRSLVQPASLSQIMISSDEEDQCVNDSKENYLSGDSSRGVQRMLHQRGNPQETSSFKFSVSRLPKWAQAKVTTSDVAPRNQESITFQLIEQKSCSPGIADSRSLFPEHQVTSNHDIWGSESCISSLSLISPKTSYNKASPKADKCSTMDKCWLTIYTVCMDLLSSPEMQKVMDRSMTGPSPRYDGFSRGQYGPIIDNIPDFTLNEHERSTCGAEYRHDGHQLGMEDISENYDPVSSDKKVQEHSTEINTATDNNACQIKSEDSDLFKQHFESLSAMHKKSGSSRRRYSSKYVVYRDFSGGAKRLFGTPVYKSAGKKILTLREESFNSPVIESSTKNKQDTEKERVPEASEMQEKLTACREALLSLDAAAENAVRLLSRLDAICRSSEEFSREPKSKLLDEAAELLPATIEKVNAIANLLQQKNKDLCGSRLDVSGFEPILGTLAENLSQRVVEILKKNLGGVQ